MVENETLRTVISGTCGGMASILAVHPLDTVRTRLQAAPAGAYRGAWHCARVTLRREGPLALYKGLAWPLAPERGARAVPGTAVRARRRRLQPRADRVEGVHGQYRRHAAGGAADDRAQGLVLHHGCSSLSLQLTQCRH